MEEDRMPTLFEILNRFSKTPLDLWSFYVFLKDQYGGVEYLEFWLDCAAHTALCKEAEKETNIKDDIYNSPTITKPPRAMYSSDGPEFTSPNSSILFNMLQEGDGSPKKNWNPQRQSQNSGTKRESSSTTESQDLLDTVPLSGGLNRRSSLSDERAKNKRDTVTRLSEILDNMYMPEYPDAAATSPNRYAKLPQDISNEYDTVDEGYIDGMAQNGANNHTTASRARGADYDIENPHLPKDPPPTSLPNRATEPSPHAYNDAYNHDSFTQDPPLWNQQIRSLPSRISTNAGVPSKHSSPNRRAVKDSAQQIINTYLSSKGVKELELPSDANGWSMAADIRHMSTFPGGLSNPKLFDSATAYVFEALEREALPAFYLNRGLMNVQPFSASLRLVIGLVAIFGGFWLSFVFVLLNWEPKSHRCWVILPFGIGMYLTFTALYHIDPLLAFAGYVESENWRLSRIQEKLVSKMLIRRGAFVFLTIIMCTAAFSVLFILVPGHRL